MPESLKQLSLNVMQDFEKELPKFLQLHDSGDSRWLPTLRKITVVGRHCLDEVSLIRLKERNIEYNCIDEEFYEPDFVKYWYKDF